MGISGTRWNASLPPTAGRIPPTRRAMDSGAGHGPVGKSRRKTIDLSIVPPLILILILALALALALAPLRKRVSRSRLGVRTRTRTRKRARARARKRKRKRIGIRVGYPLRLISGKRERRTARPDFVCCPPEECLAFARVRASRRSANCPSTT